MTDYDTPLRWEHEDGRTGEEVSQVPSEGTVFFYDAHGPVARLTDIVQARWWCLIKAVNEDFEHAVRFRVTRLEDRDGRFHYMLPGHPGVIDCECGKFPCVEVDAMCDRLAVAG